MRILTLLGLLFTVCRCMAAESPRFTRILRLYNHYRYEYDEKSFSLRMRNATHRSTFVDSFDSTALARIDTRTRELWVHAGYEAPVLEIDSSRKRWSRFQASIAYERNEGGRADPRREQNQQIVDTLAERVYLDARIGREMTGYINRSGPDFLSPFLGIDARAVSRAYYDWDELLIHSFGESSNIDKDYWRQELFPHHFTKKDYGIAGNFRVIPFAGIGRTTPTRPVEAALDLEEELLRSNLADFELSDNTVARIAVLISRYHSRRLRSHENLKAFKRELDSLLIADMAIDSNNKRLLSPFAVTRVVLGSPPRHESGFAAQVYFLEEVEAVYRKLRREFPYDAEKRYPDTNLTGPAFDGYGRLGIRVRYGTAFSRDVAFSFTGEKVLLTGDNSNGVDPYKTPDVDYSIAMHLRPLQWLQLEVGAHRVPSRIIIPRDLPGRLYTDLTIFVEDYFRVRCGISYNNREALKSNRYFFRYTSEVLPAQGPALSAFLSYSF